MQLMPSGLVQRFDALGFAIIEYALDEDDLVQMEALFPALGVRVAGAQSAAFAPGAIAWLEAHPVLAALARKLAVSGGAAGPVALTRVQAFDKSPTANWFVPWHQDRAEDGLERATADLERTVALRVHLDDCDEDNGPLEVLAGSHTGGRLNADAIAGLVADGRSLLCLAVRGDIVAMRPLAVHRSQRARIARARRVLHLEYRADR